MLYLWQCSAMQHTTVPVHTHDNKVACPSQRLHHINDIMHFNVLAVYLRLPPVDNLGLEPEEAVVQEDSGVGVGGAGPYDGVDLESGEGAVDDEVGEGGGWGGQVPCLQQDSQGAGAGFQAGQDRLGGSGRPGCSREDWTLTCGLGREQCDYVYTISC